MNTLAKLPALILFLGQYVVKLNGRLSIIAKHSQEGEHRTCKDGSAFLNSTDNHCSLALLPFNDREDDEEQSEANKQPNDNT